MRFVTSPIPTRRSESTRFAGILARMIAAIFPGQGSQRPGMGKDLHDRYTVAAAVFDAVGAATGLDARRVCFELDEDALRQTQNAQLALYTCGVAAFRAAESNGFVAEVFAGHSVGEYAALAAAGIVAIEDGAKLVQRRGDLMARSGSLRKGGMAAVLGMERDALAAVCHRASNEFEIAVIANDNCPGQLVISGDAAAVDRAGALATESGAKRVLPLNVSGAFHSPLMEEAAAAMGEALRQVEFNTGGKVVANVTAQHEPEPSRWPYLLEAQLKSPVRWTESVETMRQSGVDRFIEFGVGEVLCGLVRRIDREATSAAIFDSASLAAALNESQS